jgi:hypothetical protein
LFCSCLAGVQAKPILKFDNGLDWKQIFDAGFRPRHQNGGRTSCKVWEQEPFAIEIKGLEGQMQFDEGTLSFDFDSKEKIIGFSYFVAEAIDMAEGKRQADQMTAWLKPYVIHEMKMPRYIEGTYVDATSSNSILVARIGEYHISYRFIDTASASKQLRPKFSIYWSFPEMPTDGFIPVDRKIKPPPGYEDWDMTEVIPTTRGDVRIEDPMLARPGQKTVEQKRSRDTSTKQAALVEEQVSRNSVLPYALAAAILVILAAITYSWRQKVKRQ